VAETIRGINVVIGADTTKLSKALSDVNQKSKDIQSELKQVERLLKFDPTNTELLAQKQQLLSKAVENTSEKLNRLKSVQQQVADQFARGEISEGQYRAFQREIAKTEQELRQLQDRLQETDSVIEKQSSSWSKLQERLNGVGQRLQEVGNRMKGMTASLGAIAPTVGPALAVMTGGVMALASAFGAAGVGVIGFGAVATSTLEEVFEANEKIAKAEEKLAKADNAKERAKAMEEMKEATLGLSDAQVEAVNTLREFRSFWDDFRSSFETPVLDMFTNGVKALQQVLIMAKPAIQGAAEGINELLNMLRQSLGTSEVRSFFEYIGSTAKDQIVNFGKIAGNVFLGFMNLMTAFSPLSQDMTSGLVSMTERFREWTAALSQSAGFQQFVAYVKENGPVLLSIIGNVVKTVGSLVVALAPIGSVVGSVILNVIDAITSFIANLTNALASSESFKNGVSAIFNAIKTVVLNVFGVVRDFVLKKVEEIRTFWQQNGEQIRAAAEKVFKFIQTIVSVTMPIVLGIIKSVWENIKGVISGAINVILGLIKTFSAILTGDWKGVWEGIKKIVAGAVQFVWNLINLTFIGKVIQSVKAFGTSLVNSVSSMWSGAKAIFNSSINTVKSIVNSGFNFIKNFVSNTLGTIKTTVSNIWNGIKSTVSSAVNGIKSTVTSVFNSIKSTASSVWNGIKSLISTAVNTAKSAVSNAFSSMKSAVSSAMSSIKSTITSMWNSAVSFLKGIDLYSIGKNIIQGLARGISSMASAVVEKVRDIANSVTRTIRNILDIHSPSRETEKLGKYTGEGFAKGIESKKKDVKKSAKNTGEAAKKAFEEAFRNIQYRFDAKKINAKQAIEELEKLKKQYAKVPNAIARIDKEIYKIKQQSAKQLADENKKAFEEAFKQAQYNFKIGKIDESQYISKLRTILKEYAKTPDQVRKVNLEIKKVQDAKAKKDAEMARKLFEQGKQAIEYQKQIRNVSLEQELQWWNNLAKKFKEGTKERMEAEKEAARVKEEITKRNFENEKRWFEEKKYYGQLSLVDELKSLETVAKRYKEGSEERLYWEREIYRVKKEINDKLLAANNEYAEKVKEINERLYQDELKAKEEYETRVKEINDRLLQDEIKAKEEYEARVKEINDRLAEEERKLTEEYEKAVEDRTKSLYSFAGLFDELKRKNDVTGQGLLKNLSDQISAFKDWQANIASLAARGIDEGLLQELRDMGPKAVDEISALNSLSDEELQQYVALWREKNALAKTQAINELEGMRLETQTKIQQLRLTANTELEKVKTDYINKITELRTQANVELEKVKTDYTNKIAQLRAQAAAELEQHKNEWLTKVKEISEGTKTELNLMSASMEEIGKNSMQGLIQGLDSMIGPLRQKAQEIANIVQSTVKSTLKIKSPSRVMMELGKWVPVGLAEGINRNINAVISATNRMAQATIPTVSGFFGKVAAPATATINVPKLAGAKIEQHFHFHSTAPTPSEVARKNLQVSRQLAMEWGI
jgi:phage-related protein